MDFAITLQNGHPAMGFDQAATIFNNVYLSLTVRRGAFFQNPGFGSRLHLLKKNTLRAAALAEEYAKEALQWLLDTGKAASITIAARRDADQDLHRLTLWVEVAQKDGQVVVFEHFVEVV
jgi:phage gp46-like protein